MCFVFIWEQTATCATYSINWSVFIIEMKSVYCAVRTGSLNKAVCASYLNGYTIHPRVVAPSRLSCAEHWVGQRTLRELVRGLRCTMSIMFPPSSKLRCTWRIARPFAFGRSSFLAGNVEHKWIQVDRRFVVVEIVADVIQQRQWLYRCRTAHKIYIGLFFVGQQILYILCYSYRAFSCIQNTDQQMHLIKYNKMYIVEHSAWYV